MSLAPFVMNHESCAIKATAPQQRVQSKSSHLITSPQCKGYEAPALERGRERGRQRARGLSMRQRERESVSVWMSESKSIQLAAAP